MIVMKKLTTRGLQALAGGPSRLRSLRPKDEPAREPTISTKPLPPPLPPPPADSRDSQSEVTLAREVPPNAPLAHLSPMPKTLATPATLIHDQAAIPEDIRQMAIRSLEMQKTMAAVPPAPNSASKSATVSPVPPAPQPGAPAVLKSPVQVVVRETKRKTAFGWGAMLVALGIFVGLSTVAVIHGDAGQAFDAVKQFGSPKRPAPPLIAIPQALAAAPAPVEPSTQAQAAAPIVVADNKPAPADAKDDPKPKPDPKPDVSKPDPAPRPAQKPSNAYASTRVASAPAKPVAKPEAKDKDDVVVAAKPKKEEPKKDDAVVATKPDPKPAMPTASDDGSKISQMAQQQLGATLPP